MKKGMILLMIIAISVALFEQVSINKNIYIMVIAIVIFMIGMIQLSGKIPSKNKDKDKDNYDV